MKQETFISHDNYKWMWVFLVALIVCTAIYVVYDPIGDPSGGSIVGIAYGILAALGMFVLMWYGIRKRSYRAKKTTLKGCLSVHVWLGVSLIFLVPLHCGFSFGANVHTLAYLLMMLTILSGIWGAMSYGKLATNIQSNRGGAGIDNLLLQINLITDVLDSLSAGKSDDFLRLLNSLNFDYKPGIKQALLGKIPQAIIPSETAQFMAQIPGDERDEGLKLVSMINRKIELCNQCQDEVSVNFWLKFWLYFHLPVACAAIAALVIHIVAVLYYW